MYTNALPNGVLIYIVSRSILQRLVECIGGQRVLASMEHARSLLARSTHLLSVRETWPIKKWSYFFGVPVLCSFT